MHLDIMDGVFVPNLTYGYPIIEALRPCTKMPFEAHLMVNEPEHYISRMAELKVDYVTVHYEASNHLHKLLTEIKNSGMKAGLAFNPATEIPCLDYILPALDLILIMTVNPGFGGQNFISSVLPKITRLKNYLLEKDKSVAIAVDGGINKDTGILVREAGADILVAGSAIFSKRNYKKAVEELRGKSFR